MRKMMCMITAACSAAAAALSAFAGYAAAETVTPTAEEIQAFYAAHPFSLEPDVRPTFETPQLSDAPFALGQLSAESEQEALNCVNFMRYIAGVPADITIDPELRQQAQAASVLCFANKQLGHSGLPCPEGMAQDIYTLAVKGAKRSSLASGYYSQSYSIFSMAMPDAGDSNLVKLGHRRHLLNPLMQYTGFGQTEWYTAMYSHDESREEAFEYDYIAWPPVNMPYALYRMNDRPRYPLSVFLSEKYQQPDIETVKAEITSQKTGAVYKLDKYCTDFNYYFNIDTPVIDGDVIYYNGTDNCIVMNPGVIFDKNDTVTVHLTGLQYADGSPAEVQYTISFIDLTPQPEGPQVMPACVRPCDLNCDDTIDVRDAVLLARYAANDPDAEITEDGLENADCDRNGTVNTDDLTYILKKIANLL